MRSGLLCGLMLLAALPAVTAYGQMEPAQNTAVNLQLDCGKDKPAPGHFPLLLTDVYSKERGFGFEPGALVQAAHRATGDLISSSNAFQVSIAVPEGNYQAKSIVEDFKGLNPSKPDPVDTFYIPAGNGRNNQTPLRN